MIRALLTAMLLLSPTMPLAAAEGPRSCFALEGTRVCIGEENYVADVCMAIETLSTRWNLPPGFFARLIWQESRFDPGAISPAGAEGIAQFMPGTARLRGLDDPFDPSEALARSAQYLSMLEQRFGNLGLAAAAYNGGEARVASFLEGGGVYRETRDYVAIITGITVEDWRRGPDQTPDFALAPDIPFLEACIDMARAAPMPRLLPPAGEWQPWGVLIAQSASPEAARSSFETARARYGAVLAEEELMLISARNPRFGPQTRYSAMVGRQTRAEADAVCAALASAGGSCIVLRNQ